MIKKLLLDAWVNHRVKVGRKKEWIGNVEDEINFIKDVQYKTIKELKYIPDRNELDIMWDYQKDSRTVIMKSGGGDCNNINRCWQMKKASENNASWLITWIHKPIDKKTFDKHYSNYKIVDKIWLKILNIFGIARAHTTTIYYDLGSEKYVSNDYGQIKMFKSFREALEYIASTYDIIISEVSIQDERWNILMIDWKHLMF